MICVDGSAGLLAALPMVYPGVPIQRCWAHKIRNVLGKVKKADRKAAKAGLHAIMNAQTVPEARSAARRFADRWHDTYPKAVDCLRNDLDCPSSKQMGLLSVFHKGGSGSSLFDVKPLGFDGSSGGFVWSVF